MGRLRHRTAPGCTYFVTTDTWENREIFRVVEVAELVTQRILECRDSSAYLLHEFVVMPNHLHLLLTPGRTTTLEKAMQLIKGGASHAIHQRRGHKMQVWQPGFHESTVRDSRDYETKCAYIRMNPVKAGLAERPQDWPYGSASGQFRMDEIPQGLKPQVEEHGANVGAEAPTP
jgi:putative transposase